MDIRITKTETAIRNAFMELRSKKPLEKITVKELCQLACINKSTFYSHYADIYALSETLQKETATSIFNGVSPNYDYHHKNLDIFTRELCLSFISHMEIIKILFSGKEQSNIINYLEAELKNATYISYPEYKNDAKRNILLSYCIQGAYHAYLNNMDTVDTETLIQILEEIIRTLEPFYKE